jgi:iron complex outermembrane receptor protein
VRFDAKTGELKMNKTNRRLLPVVALFVAGGVAIPDSVLLAQGLEEIVVTARKREENLLEVPIAISAFTAADIESRDFAQLEDIQLFTPGFSFTNLQGGSARNDRSTNALVFRGLNLAFNSGVYAAGVTFIDGAPVLGGYNPSMTDVERIEILKGPQSAYFGRSTFSGAINFVTKDPGDEFAARIGVSGERYDSHEVNLSMEGPLVADKLAGRISFRDWEQGAYVDNNSPTVPAQNNVMGGRTTQSVSATLVWTPTDNLKVKGFFNYFEDEDGPGAQFALKSDTYNGRGNPNGSCDSLSDPLPMIFDSALGATRPATTADRFAGGTYCGTLPNIGQLDPSIISVDNVIDPILEETLFNPPTHWTVFDPNWHKEAGLKREAIQATLRIDYDFENGYSFSSLSAYHDDQNQTIIDLNYRDFRDRPNGAFGLCAFVFGNGVDRCRPDWNDTLLLHGKSEDWSQEFRISSPQERRFRWSAGVNIFDGHQPGGTVYGNLFVGPFFTAAITQRDAETQALFASAAYDLTDKLTLTVEGRVQEDEITETTKTDTTGAALNPPFVLNETFNSFTPRISLNWKYAENAMAYVLFSQGSRPGRFNGALQTSDATTVALLEAACPSCDTVVEESQLDNWELGWKGTWLDGRANTTIAVYYDKWKDGQVPNTIPIASGTTFNLISVTVNNGEATLKGIELETAFLATDNLTLSGTFGFSDTELDNFDCTFCEHLTGARDIAQGNEMPSSPRVSWSLSAQYDHQLNLFGSDWDGYGRADLAHQGSRYVTSANLAETSPYDDLSLRLGIRNGNLNVEAYMLNALDHDESIGGFHGIDLHTFFGINGGSPDGRNEIRIAPPLPRRWGVRASYQF